MVRINGTPENVAGMTLLAYLTEHGYALQRIAVEYNGDILPPNAYGETFLQKGDQVEIVSFVGGG